AWEPALRLPASASVDRFPPGRRPVLSADPAWSADNPDRRACPLDTRTGGRAGFRKWRPCARPGDRTARPAPGRAGLSPAPTRCTRALRSWAGREGRWSLIEVLQFLLDLFVIGWQRGV